MFIIIIIQYILLSKYMVFLMNRTSLVSYCGITGINHVTFIEYYYYECDTYC